MNNNIQLKKRSGEQQHKKIDEQHNTTKQKNVDEQQHMNKKERCMNTNI